MDEGPFCLQSYTNKSMNKSSKFNLNVAESWCWWNPVRFSLLNGLMSGFLKYSKETRGFAVIRTGYWGFTSLVSARDEKNFFSKEVAPRIPIALYKTPSIVVL